MDENLDKARHYCSYQERCIKEVKQKMHAWKVPETDMEEIIRKLQEEGFINEQRFATEYAAGKFRHNGWGLHRIRYELTRKEVPAEYIESALATLEEEEDIDEQILKLLLKKSREIRDTKTYERKQKLIRFAMSRGFSMDRVLRVIDEQGDQLLKSPS